MTSGSPRGWPLWTRLLIAGAVLVALALPVILWRQELDQPVELRDRVITRVRAAGTWGPVVVVALAAAQTLLAPIPGQVVNFAAGYLFGLWPGLFYSWAGMLVGSALAMWLARFAGRPLLTRLVDRAALDRLDRLAAGRGLGFFCLFFLIPGLPDDLLCFVAGLTRLPLRFLLPLAGAARLPGLFAAVWFGARLEQLPWQGWVAFGAVTLIVLIVIRQHGERIQDAVLRRFDRSGK